MVVLSGREPSAAVRAETAVRSAQFMKKYSRRPCLCVVLAGDDPASLTYVRNKQKACEETGIEHRDFFFDGSVLHVVYQVYEIASYAQGMIDAPIYPYLLKPEEIKRLYTPYARELMELDTE